MTALEEEAVATLQEIRDLADRAVQLQMEYDGAKYKAKVAKEAWEACVNKLQDFCRSHRTSEEVADRPLIKAVEEAAEGNGQPRSEDADWVKGAFDALLALGHTEEQARSRVSQALESGQDFGTTNEALDWIYSDPGQPIPADAATDVTADWEQDESEHHGEPVPSEVSFTGKQIGKLAEARGKDKPRKRSKAKS